jgi:hypothetical protein
MMDPKMAKLITRLAEKAESLDWKLDEVAGGYFVRLASSFVEVRSDDRDDSHPYSFLIFDGGADSQTPPLEQVNTADSDVGVDYRRLIANIYATAKRQAIGIDKRIDDMLSQLD